MNNKLFEKKLKPLSSKEFANVTAKDEDWKYLGKKLFELNDIEIGKATDINSSKTFDIVNPGHFFRRTLSTIATQTPIALSNTAAQTTLK